MAAASVVDVAGTLPVTAKTVVSLLTQPDVTRLPGVSRLAQTHPVGVVTFGVVLTATHLRATGAVRTDRTLVLTPLSRVPRAAQALSRRRHTEAVVVALTFLGTVGSKSALGTRLPAHCTHPSCRTGALPGHMMTHSSVLTRTSLLALLTVFTWRTKVFTESSRVSWRALALPGHMVTGGSVLALTLLLAAGAVGAQLALVLAAPASEARRADAGSGDGVAQRSVLTLTAVTAVGAPVLAVTGTRAVGAPPSRLALAGVGGHAAAVDTALRTVRSTDLSVLVEARAALRLPPVHRLLSSPIRRPIADPMSGAFEPVEDVGAAGVVDLIVGMSVRLLHRHRVALPVAADVWILQVQRGSDAGQEAEGHSQ